MERGYGTTDEKEKGTKEKVLLTSVCLAASIWPLGHPRSDCHVSNLRHPDCC